MAVKHFTRFDSLTGELGTGNLFIGPGCQLDLSGVRVVHSGIDTLKQLYEGVLQPGFLAMVIQAYEAGNASKNYGVKVNGVAYLVGSGGKSGYQYRLQNNDYGLTVFLKSSYATVDARGSHLKIECSPQFLIDRSFQDVQEILDDIAYAALGFFKRSGVAVHLACDIQGWQPAADFMDRFVTRSKKVMNYQGIEKVLDFNLSEVSVKYGRNETFTFGGAAALQCSIYDKTKEAAKRDKLHFWQDRWSRAVDEVTLDPTYDPEQPVWRIELRFHHSIIKEIGRGSELEYLDKDTGELVKQSAEDVNSYEGLAPHFKGLWQYGLMNYRLNYNKEWCHPVWTKLIQDVEFFHFQPVSGYRRVRKKPGEGNEKNVSLAFGNLLSVYARNRFTAQQAWQCLKQSGLWEDLCSYYRNRGIGGDELYKLVQHGLIQRRLMGRAA